MKKLLSVLFLFGVFLTVNAQSDIAHVGCGEYVTIYQKTDATVWINVWSNGKPTPFQVKGFLGKVVNVDGGQYHCTATDDLGNAYKIDQNGKLTRFSQTGVLKAYGFYESTVFLLKGGGIASDGVQLNATITVPAGKIAKKLVCASGVSFGASCMFVVFEDGDLYRYDRGKSTGTFVMAKVLDFTAVGIAAGAATTADDLLYVPFGITGSSYVGLSNGVKTITSIKKIWTDAGAKWPFKLVIGQYNTLHIIDADDYMFGSGSNPQGEVGNGQGIRYGENPVQWDWSNYQLMTAPVKIIADNGNDKWSNIETSNIITFYLYAQDKFKNWYSWARNKTTALGNGISLTPFSGSTNPPQGMDLRPNYLDVWKPHHVQPLKTSWTIVPNTPGKYFAPPMIDLPTPPVVTPPVVETVTKGFYDSAVAKYTALLSAANTTLSDSVKSMASQRQYYSGVVNSLESSVTTLNADKVLLQTKVSDQTAQLSLNTTTILKLSNSLKTEMDKAAKLKADISALLQ